MERIMTFLLTETSRLDSYLQLIGVSLLFLFILAITYFTTRFIGGIKLGQVKNSNFKVIETFKITQNKFLQLVQIGEKYIVLAISKDDIRMIAELTKDEIMQQDEITMKKQNFSEIFNLVVNKQKLKNKIDDNNKDQ
jgi:flagellar protein FliO/FliZ